MFVHPLYPNLTCDKVADKLLGCTLKSPDSPLVDGLQPQITYDPETRGAISPALDGRNLTPASQDDADAWQFPALPLLSSPAYDA